MKALWSLLSLAGLANVACLTTKLALVNVRNETATDLAVHARLVGNTAFDAMPGPLKPLEERTILQYEEPRWSVEPVSNLVDGLRLVTPATCVAVLDGKAVALATERSQTHRWLTIRVTPQTLAAAGCPTRPPSPAAR